MAFYDKLFVFLRNTRKYYPAETCPQTVFPSAKKIFSPIQS